MPPRRVALGGVRTPSQFSAGAPPPPPGTACKNEAGFFLSISSDIVNAGPRPQSGRTILHFRGMLQNLVWAKIAVCPIGMSAENRLVHYLKALPV